MNKECNERNKTLTWHRYRKADKPWRRRQKRFFGKPIELCLCPVCANTYYLMDDHYIKRVDHNQKYKESCSMCGVRNGYDYKVYDNSNPVSIQYI